MPILPWKSELIELENGRCESEQYISPIQLLYYTTLAIKLLSNHITITITDCTDGSYDETGRSSACVYMLRVFYTESMEFL